MGCQWQDGDPPVNFCSSSVWWAYGAWLPPYCPETPHGGALSSGSVSAWALKSSWWKRRHLLTERSQSFSGSVSFIWGYGGHTSGFERKAGCKAGRARSEAASCHWKKLQSGQFLNAGGIWLRKTAAQEFVKEATWADRPRSSGKDRAPCSGAARDPTQLGHSKADY